MINQMSKNENTPNQFFDALNELQIGKLLRRSNIKKSCGISAYKVFRFLLLLVFQEKNLFRFLNSKHKDQVVSKNTYYRFLNETSYNQGSFLMLLAVKVTSAFDALTRPERVKVLILDDSVVKRNRSKSVELLARVYDHVGHKFQQRAFYLQESLYFHTLIQQILSYKIRKANACISLVRTFPLRMQKLCVSTETAGQLNVFSKHQNPS